MSDMDERCGTCGHVILPNLYTGSVCECAPKLSAWQPIETAPKKTDLLLYDPEVGIGIGHIFSGDYWQIGEDDFCHPTHWMPLPDPPAA